MVCYKTQYSFKPTYFGFLVISSFCYHFHDLFDHPPTEYIFSNNSLLTSKDMAGHLRERREREERGEGMMSEREKMKKGVELVEEGEIACQHTCFECNNISLHARGDDWE